VIDIAGDIVHKATQSVEFMQEARYSVFATNVGLANDKEVIE
jgi:hypothetical protein